MAKSVARYANNCISFSPSTMMYLGVVSGPVDKVLYVEHKGGWDKDLLFRVTRVTSATLGHGKFRIE